MASESVYIILKEAIFCLNLINAIFVLVDVFVLTVTAFTVLFTAWYRPNCIVTYLFYLYP